MKLDDEEIARVCRLVDDVAGIQWDASKTYLIESRLPSLLTEFDCGSLGELVDLVRRGNNPRARTAFIDAVTTRETLFFRDQGPFEALKHKCLPEILDAKASTPYGKRIRIWSAACSSGQEPYSLGIILHELLDDLDGWDIQILATDISPAALKSARTGIYSEFEMSRGVPQNLRDKYFTRVGDGWQVIDSVRSLVSFEHRNLLEPLANMGPFDVVFCRNVAIYFEADVRADLFERITGVMAPHGALFVGGSENLSALGEKWKPLYHCRGIFYLPNRKNVGPVASVDVVGPGKTAIATAALAAQPPHRHPARPAAPPPVPAPRPAAMTRPPVVTTAGQAAPPAIGGRPAPVAAGRAKTVAQPAPPPKAAAPAARPATTPTPAPARMTAPATTRPVAPAVKSTTATSTATVPATRPATATPSTPVTRPASRVTAPSTPTSTVKTTAQATTATARPVTPASTAARPLGSTSTTRPAATAAVQKPPIPAPTRTTTTAFSAAAGATKPAVTARPAAAPVKAATPATGSKTPAVVAPPKHTLSRPVASKTR